MKSLILNLVIPYCRTPLRHVGQRQLEGTNAEKDAVIRAMIREAEAWAGELEGYEVRAVRLSGGAATVMDPDLLGQLLNAVRRSFPLSRGCEVSFDALPGTVGTPSLTGISAGRPNRAELFLRSASDLELRTLAAPFNVEDGRVAMRFLGKFRLNNIGITVHFGIPGQTVSSCLATARDLVIQNPHHIRLLPLRDGGVEGAPAREAQREMFLEAAQVFEAAGYIHYMAGHFCRPNHEWLFAVLEANGCETVSLGLGGVTALEGFLTRTTNNIKLYLRDAGDFGRQTAEAAELTPEAMRSRALRGRLAQAAGCDPEALASTFGAPLSEGEKAQIEALLASGALAEADGSLRPTRSGMFELVSARGL